MWVLLMTQSRCRRRSAVPRVAVANRAEAVASCVSVMLRWRRQVDSLGGRRLLDVLTEGAEFELAWSRARVAWTSEGRRWSRYWRRDVRQRNR